MNRALKIICIVLLLSNYMYARRGSVPFSGAGGEKIIRVVDFPDTPHYQRSDGAYIDAGYIYKQIVVLAMPVWNYDKRYIGYIGSDTSYLKLTKAQLEELAQDDNIKLPDEPELTFWDRFSGKIFFLLLGLLIIFGLIKNNRKAKAKSRAD